MSTVKVPDLRARILVLVLASILFPVYSNQATSSAMHVEVNNFLDFMMMNWATYKTGGDLENPHDLAQWIMCKVFLNEPIKNRREVIDYLDSKQSDDGGWNGTGTRMFTTHRVLLAYYLLNATPARSLDTFFSGYDTWSEARDYMLLNDARNMYHVIFGWVLYYWSYPPWMKDFFNEVEKDLSWTTSSDFHKRTHILYSYVIARRPFPNLDGIIDATLSEQVSDGHWDGSQYSFYPSHGDVYFTSIQTSLLTQILKLYPQHRTNEIVTSLNKAKMWIISQYHTQLFNDTVCGYFGNISTGFESYMFAGLLCAGQTGVMQVNIDMTFEDIVERLYRMRSDINKDGAINICDAIILARAFDSKPTNSNWNPDADINSDGIVNILDATTLALNFGKST